MRLTVLTDSLSRVVECTLQGSKDPEITGIAYDSRAVRPGDLFVALPGEHTDGRLHAASAVSLGAAAVLARSPVDGLDVPQLTAPDVRGALAAVSGIFYRMPSEKLCMVGVTGTNGKTTVTYLLEGIFREAGFNPGVIGTVNYRYNGRSFEAPHTTPEAPDLHRLLSEMCSAGVTHCAVEVSSHALSQKRVEGIRFDAAVFTNLTHEHLDYHRTMEEYFGSKERLFTALLKETGTAVVNVDDEWGRRLAGSTGAATYSLGPGATFHPAEYKLLPDGIEASIETPSGRVKVSSPLVGDYNLQNILAAVGTAISLGVPAASIERGLASVERVPGRLESVGRADLGFKAFIDYAHTGDALERSLGALRGVSEGRLITVFGCGGNRDKLKRPKMGEAATRLSDISIITSDNPRDEDPLEIIKDIEAGIKGIKKLDPAGPFDATGYTAIPDRKEAIVKAVFEARPGDTLLVAGKGHEDYQIVRSERLHFNDFEAVQEAIDLLKKTGREGRRTAG